tara:strand:- start:4888 stop:5166 length:279 start_codon:yes stop_codon:yes gene_type:complete
MRKRTGKTRVYEYTERAEPHFERLYIENKIPTAERESFFSVFLGCNPTSYKSWYKSGIKRIYYVILELLEEIEEHRKRIKILEEQLEEITKE